MTTATNNVVTKGMLFIFALLLSVSASAQEKTLFFSQYIEGSGNNKAIEIYNPTGETVSLESYQVAQSNNGNGWQYYHVFPAGASIAPYGTWVMITDQVETTLFNADDADEVLSYPSLVHHNGNDARAIIHISDADTTFLDVFGDPNSADNWAVGDTLEASREHTLIRKSSISAGNTVVLGSFGTDDATSEWMVYPQNSFVGLGMHAYDEKPFTLRDFNYYATPLTDASEISSHPLAGETRTFTAIITSYPKSSGLATPTDTDEDGTIDDISRIHVFVTDTAALSQGREGMSIQLVESDYELLEGLVRGAVVNITGTLTFFNSTAQVTVDGVELLGNANDALGDYTRYAALLDPWEVPMSDLNILTEEGTHEINIENYWKYNGSYLKFTNAVISNVSLGDRPNWAVSAAGSRIYTYDTSLRFRNDRVAYLPSYNFRQGDDPTFEPPSPGAIVNVSGFMTLSGDDPDGNVTPGSTAWSVNPFEDGVLWLNGQRFVNGENGFAWPNDLEILGLPPVFSNVAQSDSAVTSADDVTVSATVVGEDGATITAVKLVYSADGVADTLDMTAEGDVYTATIPAQANFTPVSFYLLATDSEGLTGRNPIAGSYGYFVQDGAINSIELVQKTSDGGPGASPLLGAGVLDMEITGLIVSDNEDGVIILQDAAAAWGGIFLERTTETQALSRGDEITVTAASVHEAAVASNSLTLTQLTDITMTLNSSGNDIEAIIPVIATDSVLAWTVSGELEPYEGMVVKFEDVQLIDRGSYGEYTFANLDATSEGGAIFNEDIRSDEEIGTVGVSYDFNHAIRMDKTMDAYAIVAASFGAPKFHPRNAADFVTEDANAFTPVLDFGLLTPEDSATVVVTGDVEVTWSATTDFDGDDVSYMFVLADPADSTALVYADSDFDGEDAMITIPGAVLDTLLADDFELAIGESVELLWTVWVTDGSDTLQVHGPYGNFGDDFAPVFRTITFERGLVTSNEAVNGVPTVFALEQNYPNPFNPSTNINFALPKASNVTLAVYDMLGRKVATLIDGEQMQAASHSVKFDASALASGMYIYRIEAGSFTSTRKMMLIK